MTVDSIVRSGHSQHLKKWLAWIKNWVGLKVNQRAKYVEGIYIFKNLGDYVLFDQYEFKHIDPLGQPTVTAGRDHFSNLEKQNKAKTMFATGETVGLAEWIIDDTYLVLFCLYNSIFLCSHCDDVMKLSKH